MDIAAEKLEAFVNLAERNLNRIEFQLETELTRQAENQLNPVDIISSIEDCKGELETLKKEKDELISAQEEVKEKLTKKLQLVSKNVIDVGRKMGSESNFSSNAGSVMKSHLKM